MPCCSISAFRHRAAGQAPVGKHMIPDRRTPTIATSYSRHKSCPKTLAEWQAVRKPSLKGYPTFLGRVRGTHMFMICQLMLAREPIRSGLISYRHQRLGFDRNAKLAYIFR